MKNVMAFVCASEEAKPKQLKEYCHKLMELGYLPLCPQLYYRQFLKLEERTCFSKAALASVRHCRVLVTCEDTLTSTMALHLGEAQRLGKITTTLDGLVAIDELEKERARNAEKVDW